MVLSIAQTDSFVCTQLNGLSYCNLMLIILYNTIYAFAHS